MNVELIPVIEVNGYHDDVELPEGPYWQYPEDWQKYHDDCFQKLGYPDTFQPFEIGSRFYRAIDISPANLIKVVNKHFNDYDMSETVESDTSALEGGYVLRINGKNTLFPQCCSDLGSIAYWQAIIERGDTTYFYIGHPAPDIQFDGDKVIFHCNQSDEQFVPETNDEITVTHTELEKAYQSALAELEQLKKNMYQISKLLDYQPKQSLATLLIHGVR